MELKSMQREDEEDAVESTYKAHIRSSIGLEARVSYEDQAIGGQYIDYP